VSDSTASFTCDAEIENYSGTTIKLGIDRVVTMLTSGQIMNETGIDLTGTNFVAYALKIN